MKSTSLILLLFAVAIGAEESKDGDSYLCIPDSATGFVFKETTKSWEQANFSVDDIKYLVRPTKDADLGVRLKNGKKNFAYGVWEIGEEHSTSYCEDGIDNAGWLLCRFGVNFSINVNSMRFVSTFSGGYVTANLNFSWDEDDNLVIQRIADEGGDTPYISIGKCSSF